MSLFAGPPTVGARQEPGNLQTHFAASLPPVQAAQVEEVCQDSAEASTACSSTNESARRRVTSKQAAPAWTWAELALQNAQAPPGWRVRRQAEQLFAGQAVRAQGRVERPGCYADRRAAAVQAFRQLCPTEQALWLHRADPDRTGAPARGGGACERNSAGGEEDDGENAETMDSRPVGCLLTFNGPWGMNNTLISAIMAEAACQSDSDAWQREQLALVPELRCLFAAFWLEMSDCCRSEGLLQVSAAMELSLAAEETGRIHFHVFACLPEGRMRSSRSIGRLLFQGKPASHASPCLPGKGVNRRGVATNRAHYYLQSRKTGTILQKSNWLRSRHFSVKASWIMDLWKQRKLQHAAARLEIKDARDRVVSCLSEIDKVERLERDLAIAAQAKAARSQLGMRPFKPACALETAWLQQYTGGEGGANLRRFRVLIYDGPSRTGKSERASHWFTPANTLLLNCQGVTCPCLKTFSEGAYSCVVYEEANWELMWRNRALMQAGPTPVLLGQSQCNEHAYTAFLYAVPMIVTSNDFWVGATTDARDWIEKNSYYVHVTEPTWM